MKKTIAFPAILILSLAAVALHDAGAQDLRQIRVDLAPIGDSGVYGYAQFTELPEGGAAVRVVVFGLKPHALYSAYFHENTGCSGSGNLVGTFTSKENRYGRLDGTIQNGLVEVGSVSIRAGRGDGQVLACGRAR